MKMKLGDGLVLGLPYMIHVSAGKLCRKGGLEDNSSTERISMHYAHNET